MPTDSTDGGRRDPVERPLKIFAFDPTWGRTPANLVTLGLPYEPLAPGPVGSYVAVIDEDESGTRVHEPLNLDAPGILVRGGLEPSELDPRFHQQMVYAVAAYTISAFERALGRRVRWPWAQADPPASDGDRLRLFPHRMVDANAHFREDEGAISFGYSRVVAGSGGFPGQVVFTCLDRDVIAHQTVHALLASLFPRGLSGTGPDSAAFPEGFCDLIALLQHFDFADTVLDVVERCGGRIHQLTLPARVEPAGSVAMIDAERSLPNPLLGIARQLGEGVGMGGAIRTALSTPADPSQMTNTTEAHGRGLILATAVFDALVTAYLRRTEDLRHFGTAGDGSRPLHADLARRLAGEASRTAGHFLAMCIRALDYCPPVNIQFGDFLRGLITADEQIVPDDQFGYREALIAAFGARGIYPAGITSFFAEGLRWPSVDNGPGPAPSRCEGISPMATTAEAEGRIRPWVESNRAALGLAPRIPILYDSSAVGITNRAGPDDRILREFVVKVTQSHGGSPTVGGTTIVLDESGSPKYVIARPIAESARLDAANGMPLSAAPAALDGGAFALQALPQRRPQAASPFDRRPLRIFAFDPSLGRRSGNRLTVTVPYEALDRGPVGRQVAVVDYDSSNDRYYRAVNLEDPDILRGGGLPPSDLDPRFHQQMAYALVASTIERFERTLGRSISWPWTDLRRTGPLANRLRVHPHAMQEANAYYSRDLHGLVFGYFGVSGDDAPGLPGQVVYTCLSHDIVVHETTHAVLDSLRPYFLEPTGPDAAAFHEAFADIVALLQHFTFHDALLETIRATGGRIHLLDIGPDVAPAAGGARIQAELSTGNPLVGLAREFGEALGRRGALRSALGTPPNERRLRETQEPHERGAILVAAIFDGFFSDYLRSTDDLLRIGRASGAINASGDLHPELADRLAREATDAAARFAALCIGALDYLPPVDVELGDLLRSIITSQLERAPDQAVETRAAVIDAFSSRGIYPGVVRSLTEEALRWPRADVSANVRCEGLEPDARDSDALRRNAALLTAFAREHPEALGLAEGVPVHLHTFKTRVSQLPDAHGAVRPEYHLQLTQRRVVPIDTTNEEVTFTFRGGSTVILDEDGRVRYVIARRVDDEDRLARQRDYLSRSAASVPSYVPRAPERINFAALHRGY